MSRAVDFPPRADAPSDTHPAGIRVTLALPRDRLTWRASACNTSFEALVLPSVQTQGWISHPRPLHPCACFPPTPHARILRDVRLQAPSRRFCFRA